MLTAEETCGIIDSLTEDSASALDEARRIVEAAITNNPDVCDKVSTLLLDGETSIRKNEDVIEYLSGLLVESALILKAFITEAKR